MPTIRRATIDDLEQIVALRMEFMREAQPDAVRSEVEVTELTRRYVEEKLVRGEFLVWFAEEDGHIVGTSGLLFFHRPPTFRNSSELNTYVLNMYTLPEWRSKGIATMLLGEIVEYVRTTSAKRVYLHATEMGRPVYDRFGFADSSGEMILKL